MSQNPPPRVKSGLPWWLWGMLIVATVAISVGVILTSVPEDPHAIFEDALAHLRSGDREKFPVTLERLRKFPKYEAHVKLLEGILAANENRDPRALELYAIAVQEPDIKAMALQQTGRSRVKIGDFKGAIAAYEEAIELDPEAANTSRMMLTRLYYYAGALTLAEDTVNKVVESVDDKREALQVRATIRSDQHRYQEAVEDFAQIFSTPGDFAAASPDVVESYTKCLIATGDVERLKEISNNHMAALQDNNLKAQIQLEIGADLSDVREAISNAIAGGMTEPQMKIIAANIELQGNDIKLAREFVMESLPVLPRNMDLYETAIRLFKETDEPAKLAAAQQNLDQLKDLDKQLMATQNQIGDDIDDVDGRIKMGVLLLELGDYNACQKWFALAETMEPDRAEECRQAVRSALENYGPLVPIPESEGDEVAAPPQKTNSEPQPQPKPADPPESKADTPEPKQEPVTEETPADTEKDPAPE